MGVDVIVILVILVGTVAVLLPISRIQADRSVERMTKHRESTPPSRYIPSDLLDEM